MTTETTLQTSDARCNNKKQRFSLKSKASNRMKSWRNGGRNRVASKCRQGNQEGRKQEWTSADDVKHEKDHTCKYSETRMMYEFKTKLCPSYGNPGGCRLRDSDCFNSHKRKPQRRVPVLKGRQFNYIPKMCQNFKNRKCDKGVLCGHAHSFLEIIYHPLVFRSKPCEYMRSQNGICRGRGLFCAKAHKKCEIRNLPELYGKDWKRYYGPYSLCVKETTSSYSDCAFSPRDGTFSPRDSTCSPRDSLSSETESERSFQKKFGVTKYGGRRVYGTHSNEVTLLDKDQQCQYADQRDGTESAAMSDSSTSVNLIREMPLVAHLSGMNPSAKEFKPMMREQWTAHNDHSSPLLKPYNPTVGYMDSQHVDGSGWNNPSLHLDLNNLHSVGNPIECHDENRFAFRMECERNERKEYIKELWKLSASGYFDDHSDSSEAANTYINTAVEVAEDLKDWSPFGEVSEMSSVPSSSPAAAESSGMEGRDGNTARFFGSEDNFMWIAPIRKRTGNNCSAGSCEGSSRRSCQWPVLNLDSPPNEGSSSTQWTSQTGESPQDGIVWITGSRSMPLQNSNLEELESSKLNGSNSAVMKSMGCSTLPMATVSFDYGCVPAWRR